MQSFVLVKVVQGGGGVSKQAVVSLAVSALSTGFSSAIVTYVRASERAKE
jgi:hypothetical protein